MYGVNLLTGKVLNYTHLNQLPHNKFLHPGPKRRQVQSVPQRIGSQQSIHRRMLVDKHVHAVVTFVITDLQIKMLKKEEGQLIFLEQ